MKKMISMLLALVMVLSLCVPALADVDTSKKLTFSIFMQPDKERDLMSTNQLPVVAYWSEQCNIEVDWQYPPQGSETEQLNMMLGTGDYTDVIDLGFNQENLTTLWEDGVIWDIAPYIEECMPNFAALLNDPAYADVRSALYDDEGHLFNIAGISEMPMQWGGLVYRRDILDTMTDGNIAFPSGETEPTTIADWEYMLDLMTQYFKNAGIVDHAGIILPAVGYFATGELMGAFGIGGLDYVDDEGKVRYGIAEDNFYKYLTTMKDWFEKGYVYADFASRTQDLFYLPNTGLTYGGAAGIWFGLTSQLCGQMSMPEYGIFMYVSPLKTPTGIEGVEKPLGVYLNSGRVNNNAGFAVTTACDEAKMKRILSAFDFFYSEEGSCIKTMGLTEEEGAGNYPFYTDDGLIHGPRVNNSRLWTEEANQDTKNPSSHYGFGRFPGVSVHYEQRTCELVDGVSYAELGHNAWTAFGSQNTLPLSLSFTPDETNEYTRINLNMQDYANGMIVKFIMGKEDLNPDTFAAYQKKLHDLGLDQYLQIKQDAYERFLSR